MNYFHILYLYYYYYYYYFTIIIVESKKKVGKKVGRLWEAWEAPPQSISIENKIKKVWGEASHASLIYTTHYSTYNVLREAWEAMGTIL